MENAPDELHDAASSIPAPPELIEHANELIRRFPECFWFRHPAAKLQHLSDIRLVIEHLREYVRRFRRLAS